MIFLLAFTLNDTLCKSQMSDNNQTSNLVEETTTNVVEDSTTNVVEDTTPNKQHKVKPLPRSHPDPKHKYNKHKREETTNMTVDGNTIKLNANNVNDMLANAKAQQDGIDPEEAKAKAKKIVEEIKQKAETINIPPLDLEQYNDPKYKRFLTQNKFGGISMNGIDQEEFINSFGIFNYKLNQGVDESLVHDIATQMYYVNKLGKIFDWDFVIFADGSLKFTNIDLVCCDFLKQHPLDFTYSFTYKLLEKMLFKLIVSTCLSTESAFKSEYIWINDAFKNATKTDVIMLTSLPDKLLKSFTIFIEELGKTSDCYIFNDLNKLVQLNREHQDMELEPVLASAIKGMTPMFIYDYFNCVKSIYIFLAMYNYYIYLVESKKIRYSVEDVHTIAVCCSIMYQNTRLVQHGLGRQLPNLSKNGERIELDSHTQLYYLNHTIMGPQFLLLKCFEEAVCSLKM